MSKEYTVDFSLELKVVFPDPVAIKAYYIDGDWKNSFYRFSSLEDMTRCLSYDFQREPGLFYLKEGVTKKEVDGYPPFIRDEDNWCKWVSKFDGNEKFPEKVPEIIIYVVSELVVEDVREDV